MVLRFDSTAGPNGCWPWLGYVDKQGYGRMTANGRRGRQAYREVYELFVGPVPNGLELDHLCRNRACVNPRHLEPVTRAENLARGIWIRPTHCVNGHPFDEVNTYIRPNGRRDCRRCIAARQRAYQQRLAERAA